MQFGHVGIVLVIASFDWNPETVAVVSSAHFLPNLDDVLTKAGLAKEDFHFTVMHTLVFALLVSAGVALFSPHHGQMVLASMLAHYLADAPTNTGLMLFWPFSRRRYSLNLWKETGFWGKSMVRGYYAQPFSWILEVPVFLVAMWRLIVVYSN